MLVDTYVGVDGVTTVTFRSAVLWKKDSYSSTLKMEAIRSPETSLNLYRTLRRYVTEHSNHDDW
jgi:hypothetical protein